MKRSENAPPDHSCEKTQVALWRYVDRELSAGEIAAISVELRHCENCARAYEQCAREARLSRMAFVDVAFGGEGFVTRFQQRFEDEGLDKTPPRRPGLLRRVLGGLGTGSGSARTRGALSEPADESLSGLIEGRSSSSQRRRRLIAVAAMLFLIPTIVGIGIYFSDHGSRSLGTYRIVGSGNVSILEEGSNGIASSADPEGRFRTQTRFRIPEGAELHLALGGGGAAANKAADISVIGPAVFQTLDGTVGEFFGYLRSGQLVATVAKREAGDRFVIRTPGYGVKVIGTRFTLTVLDDERTRLGVETGRVVFGPWDEMEHQPVRVVVVDAGQSRTLPLLEEVSEGVDARTGAAVGKADGTRDGAGAGAGHPADKPDAVLTLPPAHPDVKGPLDKPVGKTKKAGGLSADD